MNQKNILKFLRQVATHNNREWFQEHKSDYEAARAEFELSFADKFDKIVINDKLEYAEADALEIIKDFLDIE